MEGGTFLATGSTGAGLRVGADSKGRTLQNAGQILSVRAHGVDAGFTVVSDFVTLYDSGVISGAQGAFIAGTGTVRITNRGTMAGDVIKGVSEDLFDTRGDNLAGAIPLSAGRSATIFRAVAETIRFWALKVTASSPAAPERAT